jgi:hypothetical protein
MSNGRPAKNSHARIRPSGCSRISARLPPHLEETVPLAFANPDSLAFAVASTLQRRAEPLRVAHWSDHGLREYQGPYKFEGVDTALYAEYVPPGIPVLREPEHHA